MFVVIDMGYYIKITNLGLVIASLVVAFFLMEAILALLGFNRPYRLFPRIPKQVRWLKTSEETGSHYVPGKYKPQWPINNDGYLAPFDFVPGSGTEAPCRVLLLGDSYTFGIGASSYSQTCAKILEEELRRKHDVAIWNTGIPGIGQRQELISLHKYFPILRPQIVVLLFCLNDLEDNLFPPGNYYVFEDGLWVQRYALESDGRTRIWGAKEAYLRAVRPANFKELLCTSRVISLLASTLSAVGHPAFDKPAAVRPSRAVPPNMHPDRVWRLQVHKTTQLMEQIGQFVRSNGAHLLVVPIPVPYDLGEHRPQCVFDICRDIGIECLGLGDVLTESDFLPDYHWKDSGHRKVGLFLAAKIASLIPELSPASDSRLSAAQ